MPQRERARRMRALRRRVRENDVAKWSATFLETLTGAGIIAPGVPDALRGRGHAARDAPSGCSSRSTSTARSRPLVDRPEDARATERARARDRAARRDRRHPRRDRLGPRAREPRARSPTRRRHPAQRLARRRAAARPRPASPSTCATPSSTRSSGSPRILDEVAAGRRRRLGRAQAGRARPAHARGSTATAGTALQHVARERVERRVLGLTVRTGKDVIEFAVRSSDKGEALTRLRQHVGATRGDLRRRRRHRRRRVRRARRRRRRREGRPGQVGRDLPRAQPRGRRRAARAPRRCA